MEIAHKAGCCYLVFFPILMFILLSHFRCLHENKLIQESPNEDSFVLQTSKTNRDSSDGSCLAKESQ